MHPTPPQKPIDLAEVRRLLDTLEADLARVPEDSAAPARLSAEVEQLRAALAAAEPHPAHVELGLQGLRTRLHHLGDELFDDAVKSGDYLARIGRLLGL